MGAAARPGGGDDLRLAVPVDVARRDPHAAGEIGRISKHLVPGRRLTGAGVDLEDAHVGPAAGTRSRDDFRASLIVEIGRGDEDPAGERWVVGEESAHALGTPVAVLTLKTRT